MMKISKCKKELARIISEHGGWRNGEFAAQDGDGGVGGYGEKPVWSLLGKYWRNEAFGEWFVANKIKNHHQTVLSRDEYFHLYPSPDADGWIEWSGGECPVGEGDRIDVKFSDGDEFFDVDSDWDWGVDAGGCNIIAYRRSKPERVETVEYNDSGVVYTGPVQSAPQFCESVMRSIPEYEINSKNIDITKVDDIGVVESKPTIEQLATDYRNAKDYAERKQQEADAAKADAGAKMKALELAGESLGLLVSPITAKQEPEMVISAQVGDEVECIKSNVNHNKYRGMLGTVL